MNVYGEYYNPICHLIISIYGTLATSSIFGASFIPRLHLVEARNLSIGYLVLGT